jgi:metal-sulfur cluster biosynthetic enzyme
MSLFGDHPLVPALLDAFGRVYDPEFGVSIRDLGLIYEIEVDDADIAHVKMTLTSMYCPAGGVILDGIRAAAEAVPGVRGAEVELVWEPAWSPEFLSPSAREQLGWNQPQVNA